MSWMFLETHPSIHDLCWWEDSGNCFTYSFAVVAFPNSHSLLGFMHSHLVHEQLSSQPNKPNCSVCSPMYISGNTFLHISLSLVLCSTHSSSINFSKFQSPSPQINKMPQVTCFPSSCTCTHGVEMASRQEVMSL